MKRLCLLVLLALLLPVAGLALSPTPYQPARAEIVPRPSQTTYTIRYSFERPRAREHLLLLFAHANGEIEQVGQPMTGEQVYGGQLTIQANTLPAGTRAVELRLCDTDQQPLQTVIVALPRRGRETPLVTFRPSDRGLIVQGKPFFPIGIYESPGNARYMKALGEAGFNLCHIAGVGLGGLSKLLDLMQANGLRVWISASHLLDFSQDAEYKKKELVGAVEHAGSHPGLLCWESIDEPAWGKQSAEGLYEGYRFLRTLDPLRPIWTNHAPRNTIAELALFNRGTDIAGVDIYPVPEPQTHSDLPNKTISVVGDETDKNLAAVEGKKPIFMVLQGFAWAELSKANPSKPPVYPTFAQSRFMAYDAIVHGANGILYWGTNYTAKPSRFWSELRSLVSELAALQEVLASETVTGAGVASVTPAGSARLLQKRTGSTTTLILVNEKPEAVKVTLTVPRLKSSRLKRLFEARECQVTDGKLTLELPAYDVAVLSDNLRFADRRRDFSAEWQTAQPTPPAQLQEPGNVLLNPGFEVDAGMDGVPDKWSPHVALTAKLSPLAHSGKNALRLQGVGGTTIPLLVQHGLDLKAGRRYRFNAWVKSDPAGSEFRIYSEWVIEGKFHAKCLPWTKGPVEWQQVSYEFEALPDPQGRAYAVVQVRGEGATYFDDLRLEEVK